MNKKLLVAVFVTVVILLSIGIVALIIRKPMIEILQWENNGRVTLYYRGNEPALINGRFVEPNSLFVVNEGCTEYIHLDINGEMFRLYRDGIMIKLYS